MFERFILFLLVVLVFAVEGKADGVIRDSLGAVSTGRGGANIGFADNGQMILDNPGALTNMNSMKLSEFGFDLLLTDLDYSDPSNPRASAIDNPFPMAQISLASKSRSGEFGLGFGIFPHAGFSAEYEMNGPAPFSGRQHYKSIGALIRFLSAASWQMTDRFSVGANVGVAVSHMELEGPYTLQGPNPFRGTPTRFDFQGTGAALSWAAGLQYKLSPATTMGVTYQHQTGIDLDGTTFVEIPGLGSSRFDSELAVVWPKTIGVGVQHEVNCCSRLGLDLVWFDWSEAFDNFGMTLRDPDNPVFGAVVGNELLEDFPLNWRDTLSVRFGFERDLANGHVIRTGYVWHRNPIPPETLTPFIQTTLEHAFSVGYGWRALGNDVDLAYQYSFANDQSVGTSQFIGGDFDNSTVGTQAHWFAISNIRRF